MSAMRRRGQHDYAGDRLIITADDFGLADAVNEAVELAHRSGLLSATSLMVSAPAASDAVCRAKRLPDLAVGLHLVLVEQRPTLPPSEIPDLVDNSGRLRCDLVRFSFDIASRASLRRQLRAEIEAQFRAFAETGLTLDHVDAHKHFHLHPLVAREIMCIGKRFGMRALRVPAEPRRPLNDVDKTSGGAWLAPWSALLRRQARRAGLVTADAVFGLAWSGAFTEERLVGLLEHLPHGLIEIYLHPALNDDFAGHAPAYHYAQEFAALCTPAARAALQRSGFRLAAYRDTSQASAMPVADGCFC